MSSPENFQNKRRRDHLTASARARRCQHVIKSKRTPVRTPRKYLKSENLNCFESYTGASSQGKAEYLRKKRAKAAKYKLLLPSIYVGGALRSLSTLKRVLERKKKQQGQVVNVGDIFPSRDFAERVVCEANEVLGRRIYFCPSNNGNFGCKNQFCLASRCANTSCSYYAYLKAEIKEDNVSIWRVKEVRNHTCSSSDFTPSEKVSSTNYSIDMLLYTLIETSSSLKHFQTHELKRFLKTYCYHEQPNSKIKSIRRRLSLYLDSDK